MKIVFELDLDQLHGSKDAVFQCLHGLCEAVDTYRDDLREKTPNKLGVERHLLAEGFLEDSNEVAFRVHVNEEPMGPRMGSDESAMLTVEKNIEYTISAEQAND